MTAIVFTLPTQGQRHWVDPSMGADSFMTDCSGGDLIHHLMTSRLYRSLVSGGGYRLWLEKSAVAREGTVDSFTVDPTIAAHYYVTVTNNSGESCASSVVYVPGSTTTGVGGDPPGLVHDVAEVWFNVHGQRIDHPTAAGVYWRAKFYRGVLIGSRRVVVLR